MSKVEPVILATNPYRPINFNEKSVQKVIDKTGILVQTKKDGVRLNLCIDENLSVKWLSREGKAFPALAEHPLAFDPNWAQVLNTLGMSQGIMIDAELVLLNEEGAELPCKNISGNLRRENYKVLDQAHRPRVYIFDFVCLDVIKSGTPCSTQTAYRVNRIPTLIHELRVNFPQVDWISVAASKVSSLEDLEAAFFTVREVGEEGLVLKDPLSTYQRSKRAGWWKMVPDDNIDGTVTKPIWGTEGLANEGKVIGFEVLLEDGTLVNACKISQAQMEEFTANVKANPEYYFGWTVRVTFMERYPDGSLRHPSFDCFRGISSPTVKE